MDNKIFIHDFAPVLMSNFDLTKAEADAFIKAMFDVVVEQFQTENVVKIKGLGSFKLVEVSSRESVDVNTGKRIEIKEHKKVVFTPESQVRDEVNKPFALFQTILLDDAADISFFEKTDLDPFSDEVLKGCPMSSTLADNESTFQGKPSAVDSLASNGLEGISIMDQQQNDSDFNLSSVSSNPSEGFEPIPLENDNQSVTVGYGGLHTPSTDTIVMKDASENSIENDSLNEDVAVTDEIAVDESNIENPSHNTSVNGDVNHDDALQDGNKSDDLHQQDQVVEEPLESVPSIVEEVVTHDEVHSNDERGIDMGSTSLHSECASSHSETTKHNESASILSETNSQCASETASTQNENTPDSVVTSVQTESSSETIQPVHEVAKSAHKMNNTACKSKLDETKEAQRKSIKDVLFTAILTFTITVAALAIFVACYLVYMAQSDFSMFQRIFGNSSSESGGNATTVIVQKNDGETIGSKSPANTYTIKENDSDVTRAGHELRNKTKQEMAKDYPQVEGGHFLIVGTDTTITVKVGFTLLKLSQQVYGSKDFVRYIVLYNDLKDPDNVPLGSTLKVPKLIKR